MYALIANDLSSILKRREQVNLSQAITTPLPNGKPFWVPVVEEVADTSTGPDRVVSPWVETIELTRVLRSRSIRDKTTNELDAEDVEIVNNALLKTSLMAAMLKWIFDAENRIRVLEGDSLITEAQFKTAIKNRIRT